jgi:hypothetical protein
MKRIAVLGLLTGVLTAAAFSISGCGCKSGGTNVCTAVGTTLQDSQAFQSSQQSSTKQTDSSKKSKVQGGGNGQ